MKHIFSVIFALLLLGGTINAQIVERSVEGIEYIQTNDELIYQGIHIPVLDISYHEFSSDSITWRKDYQPGDCYMRFANTTSNTTNPYTAKQGYHDEWFGLNLCDLGGEAGGGIDTMFVYYYQSDTIYQIDTIVIGDTNLNLKIPSPETITGSTTNYSDTSYHTHAVNLYMGDIRNVDTTGVQNGQVLKWNSVTKEWITANDLVGAGGSELMVEDIDGTPSISNVNTIQVENGHFVNNGAGSVTISFDLEPVNGEQDFYRTDTVDAVAGNNTLTFSRPLPATDYVVTNAYALYSNGERQSLSYDSKTVNGFRVLDVIGESQIHYEVVRNLDSLFLAISDQGKVLASATDDALNFLDSKTDDSTITVTNDELTVIGVPVASISNEYNSIQDFVNLSHSTGMITGGVITDAGSQTVDVSSGEGWIRPLDDDMSELTFFGWDAVSGTAISVGVVYIGVEYNSGTPQVVFRSTNNWDLDTDFPLGVVVRDNGVLHIMNNPYWVGDPITNITQRIQSEGIVKRDDFTGGVILGETGTRNITVSAGKLWSRLNDNDISAFSTAGTDVIDFYYRDGAGGFTAIYGETQWNNTQYDDGSGTLATIPSNRYAVQWYYIDTEGKVSAMFGRASYVNSALAENEAPPATLPSRISETCILIGNIIFQEGATSALSITSAFETDFSGTLAADHSNLANLDYNNSGHTGFAREITVTTVNSATYSTLTTDDILLVTYTATGACAITLDTDDLISGRVITIKATTGVITNNVTISTEGSELIDGSATFTLSSNYDAIDVFSDGTNWYIK